MIARRCLLCPVSRSGSPGLSRIPPGLALGSVTRPERTFEVFRSTSPTDPASLRSWSSTLSSAPLRSSHLLPGPAHADLLSWGWTRPEGHPCSLCPSPLRRPSFRTPLSRSPPRVHSRIQTFAWVHRLRDATPEVPFRPRGFSPPRRFSPRYGSQACCILLPTLGFASFPAGRSQHSPRRYHPSKNITDSPWALPSPGSLAPLVFPLLRGCHLRGCFRRIDSVTPTTVASRRCPGSSWASMSSSRLP